MVKKVLLIILLLFAVTGKVFAGSAYVDVPFTVTYTGSCSLYWTMHAGSVSSIRNTNTYDFTMHGGSVTCPAGTAYTITAELPGDSVTLSKGSDTLILTLYRNSAMTDQITQANKTIQNGTGTGEEEVTVNVWYKSVAGNGCNTYGSKTICPSGNYTGGIVFRVTW